MSRYKPPVDFEPPVAEPEDDWGYGGEEEWGEAAAGTAPTTGGGAGPAPTALSYVAPQGGKPAVTSGGARTGGFSADELAALADNDDDWGGGCWTASCDGGVPAPSCNCLAELGLAMRLAGLLGLLPVSNRAACCTLPLK